MGNLCIHPIQQYKKDYNLTVFIETGTSGGGGVETALRGGFKEVYSCECAEDVYNEAYELHGKKPGVNLFLGFSKDTLIPMLSSFNNEKNVLFWLDAHLPVKEEGMSPTEVFPLEEELKIITKTRNVSEDVFIIDDLMVFDKALQVDGFNLRRHTSVDITDIITKTEIKRYFPNHEIKIDTRFEGTISFLPKQI